jgi:hypothetical protein
VLKNMIIIFLTFLCLVFYANQLKNDNGRYQIYMSQGFLTGNVVQPTIYLKIDTRTGKTWHAGIPLNAGWQSLRDGYGVN